RDEFLAMEEFESLREARMRTRDWREDYNNERPHSSLRYMTPAEFAGTCAASGQAMATPPPSLQQHNPFTQNYSS
ncbi:integrase core domain-containing protein, partial [bacterium]|nr:integrase core domain-containing protein [bacterium]